MLKLSEQLYVFILKFVLCLQVLDGVKAIIGCIPMNLQWHWVKHGMEWNGMDWNGLEWNGMDWIGLDWIGLEWNGMEWNGMEFYSIMSS